MHEKHWIIWGNQQELFWILKSFCSSHVMSIFKQEASIISNVGLSVGQSVSLCVGNGKGTHR